MKHAQFLQFYFQGWPVLSPLFPAMGAPFPVPVKAGNSLMLELASGKYNVDSVLWVNPETGMARRYEFSVQGSKVHYRKVW